MFERIRPDILVNNYSNLVAIRDEHISEKASKLVDDSVEYIDEDKENA